MTTTGAVLSALVAGATVAALVNALATHQDAPEGAR